MKLPRKLVFATNNAHKLQEARAIIESLRMTIGCECEVLSLNDIDCHDEIPEDAPTLEGNALQKARWVAEKYGCDCFADDTGLEVEALGGLPGVHTARFASLEDNSVESHDSKANMRLLLKKLEGAADRSARFRTAIAIIVDGKEMVVSGEVCGSIATAPMGEAGFGYDPVFIPDGFTKSFAQMPAEQKNSMSHRGRALAAMVALFADERNW